MTTVKISQLPTILGADTATTDVLPIVDVSGNVTNKITREEFFKNIASVDINGGTIDGTVIGGTTPAAISGTTITGTSFVTTGDMTFGDNDKAIFGAGSDLQIYHDASLGQSRIQDVGTGSLYLQGDGGVVITNSAGTSTSATFASTGATSLSYNGTTKFATTGTGIDVTGTVTADGLTVDGIFTVNDGTVRINMFETDVVDLNTRLQSSNGTFLIRTLNDASTSAKDRIQVDHATGDISFYEDTGTTPKFFWDASAERLGINVTDPIYPLEVQGQAGIELYNGTGGGGVLNFRPSLGDANKFNLSISSFDHSGGGVGPADGLSINGFDGVSFATGSSTVRQERMRITSTGNVGIGTASPAGRLHIAAVDPFNEPFRIENTSGATSFDIRVGTGATLLETNGAQPLGFATNNTERARIDASGNVGIGTSSPTNLLHVKSAGSSTVALFGDSLANNKVAVTRITTNPSYVALAATTAVGYLVGGPSVAIATTAADGSSEVERLRITSTGNVGIGTSLPDTELHIEDATGNAVVQIESSATGYSAVFFGDVNDGDVGQIRYDHSDNSMRFGTDATAEVMRITSTGNVGIGNGKQYYWGTGRTAIQGTSASDIMQFFTASLERLRIDSSGNLLVGKTATGYSVDGAEITSTGLLYLPAGSASAPSLTFSGDTNTGIGFGGADILYFTTGGTERMRITSGGVVLVNRTSTSYSGQMAVQKNSGGYVFESHRTGTGSEGHTVFINGNGAVGTIATNGSSTSYNTSSDYRLKEDVQPMSGASDRVLALNPVNFAWKADGTRVDGFLAHEAQAIVPAAVTGEKDGEEMQAIDHSKLVPLLTAALQEALTEIALLKARLDAANI